MPHIQDGRHRKKHRAKSVTRKARDNARAAASRTPFPAAAGQDVTTPVLPELPGQDRDKSPPKSHQLTTPSPSQQPPPRHTSPLPTLSLPTSLPSLPRETSQEKKAESVETRPGPRSVRFSEETEEKETMELAPHGAEKLTEEEVAHSQHSPSSHQGWEAVEQKEDDQGKDGLMPASFWQQQLEVYEKRYEDLRKLRQASSPVKPTSRQ